MKSEIINVLDWKRYVVSFGTPEENWTPAISAAIQYAAANGIGTVYIPAGHYFCDADNEKMESWELEAAAIYLPDAPITITGDGDSTVLEKGAGLMNIMGMFRTAFRGTAPITIANLKLQGNGNPGPSGSLVDGIQVNGSRNGSFVNITVDSTKRHGFYLICGADNNTIIHPVVSNANRECLGTGIQLEGASFNRIYDVKLTNIGANAIDFNYWSPGGFLPGNNGSNGSPYDNDYHPCSVGNTVCGGNIIGTGVQNGNCGGGGFSISQHDDDHYGLNLIGGSADNTFLLDTIKDVRLEGPNKYNGAIRLMGARGNKIYIKKVTNCSNDLIRFTGGVKYNSVIVDCADNYRGETVFETEDDAENITIVNDNQYT